MARFILPILLIFISTIFGSTKRELEIELDKLRKEKLDLEERVKIKEQENTSLSKKIGKIANIEIDDVITPDEQPKEIKIGEAGWRLELNGTKYKSDLIGQLGTIWLADTNNQLQPQGCFVLNEYQIEPLMINPEKDVIYRKFISKSTKLNGDGGSSFAKLNANLTNDQYAQFTINIEGTSLIKLKYGDLRKMANETKELFEQSSKGIYVCTGMHVVKYNSKIYSKSAGDSKITTPMVNISGEFFAESNEETNEYLVVRQLTRLIKPVVKDTTNMLAKINTLIVNKKEMEKLSPQELLYYLLQKEPNFDEIINFNEAPNKVLDSISDQQKLLPAPVDLKLLKNIIPKPLNNSIESMPQLN